METLLYTLLIAVSSHATNLADARCYEIPVAKPQLAEAPEHLDHDHAQKDSEVWCYQGVEAPRTGTFIYNADEPTLRPELSMVRDENGDLTHGSLLQGDVTYHKVDSDTYNPFSIPLKEPTHLPRVINPRVVETDSNAFQIFNDLLRVRDGEEPADLSVKPGRLYSTVARKPWRGYWWPQKGQTLAPTLRKYDNVLRANGQPSYAVGWEANRHVWGGAWWEGHCNGWAAASIMRPEPRTIRLHSGEEFGIGNQKGLLSEKDYCAKAAFFGGRSMARNGEVHAQYITAHEFHTTLRYYIGSLNKPVAMDYQPSGVVDNHVVSGYSMDIEDLGAGRLKVTNVLTMHKYDGKNTDETGIAPEYNRTYSYILVTDANNVIVSSSWLSGNPDFVWVPLSTSTCAKGNQYVTEDWIQAIIYR